MLHGGQCLAQCQPGFTPSRNLTCDDGQFVPEVRTGEVWHPLSEQASFECIRIPGWAVAMPPVLMSTTLHPLHKAMASMLGEGFGLRGVSGVLPAAVAVVLIVVSICAACWVKSLCKKLPKVRKSREVLLSDSEGSHLNSGRDAEQPSRSNSRSSSSSCGSIPPSGAQLQSMSSAWESEILPSYSQLQSGSMASSYYADEVPTSSEIPLSGGTRHVEESLHMPVAVSHAFRQDERPPRQLLEAPTRDRLPQDPRHAVMHQSTLESLKPKGLSHHAKRNANTPPASYAPSMSQAPSFRDGGSLQSQTPGTSFADAGQRWEAMEMASMQGAGGYPQAAAPYAGQNSYQAPGTQERILASSWHRLGRLPKHEPVPEHNPWSDVRVEEHGMQAHVPWSDVRINE